MSGFSLRSGITPDDRSSSIERCCEAEGLTSPSRSSFAKAELYSSTLPAEGSISARPRSGSADEQSCRRRSNKPLSTSSSGCIRGARHTRGREKAHRTPGVTTLRDSEPDTPVAGRSACHKRSNYVSRGKSIPPDATSRSSRNLAYDVTLKRILNG